MNDEQITFLRKIAERSAPKIKESSIYMGLFSKEFIKDPQCVMEFGMAVLLDKPIMLININGQPIPNNLKRLAIAIEDVNDGPDGADMERAVNKIVKLAENLPA